MSAKITANQGISRDSGELNQLSCVDGRLGLLRQFIVHFTANADVMAVLPDPVLDAPSAPLIGTDPNVGGIASD